MKKMLIAAMILVSFGCTQTRQLTEKFNDSFDATDNKVLGLLPAEQFTAGLSKLGITGPERFRAQIQEFQQVYNLFPVGTPVDFGVIRLSTGEWIDPVDLSFDFTIHWRESVGLKMPKVSGPLAPRIISPVTASRKPAVGVTTNVLETLSGANVGTMVTP